MAHANFSGLEGLVVLISRISGLSIGRVECSTVDSLLLPDGLPQDGVHEVLQVPGLALLLDPVEDTPGQLSKVVHAHLLVEGLEQRVHEVLEHLQHQVSGVVLK